MHVSKMDLDISIDHHYTSKIYTTGSSVAGSITISPETDIQFHCVQITLVGTSYTRIDMLPTPKTINNVFLELDMPISETSYPRGRVFLTNQTYHIPFNFTIPNILSTDACNNSSEPGHIHDLHMRLPPTMGSWEKDDMAPMMAKVEYAIVARVLQKRASNLIQIMDNSLCVKVLPGFPEDPPLRITSGDTRYALQKTKSVRRNLLSTQKDRLTVATSQPSAVHLSTSGHQLDFRAPAVLNLTLSSSSALTSPPEITVGQVRLEALTWFSGTPINRLPELGESRDVSGFHHESKYSTSVKLPSIGVGGITWQQSSDINGKGSSTWSTAISIPIQLPTTQKMFVPTFYSCFIARTYILHLPVTFSGTKTTLAVPLQIAVQPPGLKASEPEGEELPPFDASLSWR